MELEETHKEITENFIDLERIINNKNPKLLKLLPGFAIDYLKRVIHQQEINKAIYRNRDKYGLAFCNAILEEFKVKINVKGIENISATGREIVSSNHPLGGLDGMALMSVCGRVRADIVFPVNDILMNLPNLKELFIPVNKTGSNIENYKIIEETFASSKLILYFPAGLCSRKQNGKIMDLEWKKTIISKAIKHRRDIIPCHIDGRNSEFFYRFANIRKRIGIKTNIEMLYLVDEMYKQNNKNINITFGRPIGYKIFDNRRSSTEWAGKMREYVYKLGKGYDKPFDEFTWD